MRHQELTIGVEENKAGANIQIFPNPTSEFLTVSSSQPGTLRVLNISGQQVITTKVTGIATLDVSHLPQGVYMVILEQQDKATTGRFVKQ